MPGTIATVMDGLNACWGGIVVRKFAKISAAFVPRRKVHVKE